MKATLKRKELKSVLMEAKRVLGRGKQKLDILNHVLLEVANNKLCVSVSVLDTTFSATVPTVSTAQGPSASVPCKDLYKLISSMEGDTVEIVYEPKECSPPKVQFITDKLKADLHAYKGEEFAKIPRATSNESQLAIPMWEFHRIIERVKFAFGDDDNRPWMSGVRFFVTEEGNLEVVATNGHILSRIEHTTLTSFNFEREFVVNGESLVKFARNTSKNSKETVTLVFDRDKEIVQIDCRDRIYTAHLIDQAYPSFRQVIPECDEPNVKLYREELIDALKRVEQFVSKGHPIVHLTFHRDENKVVVTASDLDKGTLESSAYAYARKSFKPETHKVGINSEYLSDTLKALDTEEVELSVNTEGNMAALLFTEPDNVHAENTEVVIMPVRI